MNDNRLLSTACTHYNNNKILNSTDYFGLNLNTGEIENARKYFNLKRNRRGQKLSIDLRSQV